MMFINANKQFQCNINDDQFNSVYYLILCYTDNLFVINKLISGKVAVTDPSQDHQTVFQAIFVFSI